MFYSLFYHKWWFDELYRFLFVRPVLRISGWVAAFDKKGIDWAADNLARAVIVCARLDNWIDRIFVDRLIDLAAAGIYAIGIRLRRVQSGNLRQYIMLLALGLIALFVAMNLYSKLFDFWMVKNLKPLAISQISGITPGASSGAKQ